MPESVGITPGLLIAAIHHVGFVCLAHTPNPVKVLGTLCGRPSLEKPVMILTIGYPAEGATVAAVAKRKKAILAIMTAFPADSRLPGLY